MATTTTVSAWGKAGAWALDSEEHEEELMNQTNQQEEEEKKKKTNKYSLVHNQSQPLSDFPSLSSAAAVTKTKKKKPQAVPLSEFTTGKSVSYGSAAKPKGLTPDELFLLPTGPRERSAEELDRSSSSRLGGGFRSYGSSSDNNNRDDSRWGSNRDDPRRTIREPAPPSRADEIDDWGAAKKSSSSSDNRRERASPGFFDSQSRADESDSWLSKKSFIPSSSSSDHPRRMGMGGGAGGGGFERDRRGGGFDKEISGSGAGAGADSDNWGKKRPQDTGPNNSDNGARPKLVLQPRSLPATNEEQQQQPGSASVTTTKSNPFGAARPREQVLAEKGQDWKKIDEQLESIKLKDDDAFGKKTFGNGNGRLSSPEARTERSWRKTISVDSPTPSEEKADKEDDGGARDEN